jgi:hypothetical protein
MKRILLATVAVLALTSSASAAEISSFYGDDYFCRLRGEIKKGDYEKVSSLFKNYASCVAFEMNYPGGDVDEAMKIGRLFRKYLVSTMAIPHSLKDKEEDDPCASACALIWFGGVNRTGKVGLHRPYTDDPRFKGLSPEEASRSYRQMLSNVTNYLTEIEVPKSIIEIVENTSSGDIHWVSFRWTGSPSQHS